jgi:hypothetical protein
MMAATVLALQLGVTSAVAQDTTSTVSQSVVAPGQPTTVLVTGIPGYYYAVIGSTTGAGFSYAGVALAVGPDVQILAMGNLDGMGQAVVTIVPPFYGTSLDRIYIQAATSPAPNFVPLQVAPGNVLVNADLSGLVAAGLTGPAGPEGPAGAPGAVGPAGAAGPVGPMGPQGAAGADGAVGPQGPAGLAGSQGPAGLDGAAGAAGPQGPAGLDGAVGSAGPQGPAGLDGVAGPQGPAGLDGAAGPAGPQGLVGPQGPAGPDGAPGAAGPMGPQGPQGNGGPAGPAGPAGSPGTQGVPGVAGPMGPMGPQGLAGGVTGYELVSVSSANNDVSPKSLTATCPAGKVVMGGGAVNNATSNIVLDLNGPAGNNAWSARMTKFLGGGNFDWTLTVSAICGTVQP